MQGLLIKNNIVVRMSPHKRKRGNVPQDDTFCPFFLFFGEFTPILISFYAFY